MLQLNQRVLIGVLKDFYTLTKIRIVLWDSEYNEVLCYPKQRIPFCHLIRQNSEIDARCVACDRTGCKESKKNNGLFIYRCHAGLTEAVVPIKDHHGTIGYIFFGQTITEGSHKQTKERLLECFPEEQFPEIKDAIARIEVKTEQELNAASTILQALTSYILSNQWVKPQRSDFIRQLDAYILDNISGSITVEQLCKAFRIGRTRFYELTKSFLEYPIAEYIRLKRIEEAQRLLQETSLSIAEIAEITGFSNYNHFFRVFREKTGMSARKYRQTNVS